MSRVNVYERVSDDDSGFAPPKLLGWFDPAKAARWSDADYNGNGSGGTGRGQAVLLTSGGRWVHQQWSAWQDERDTFTFIDAGEAREWLIANGEDEAVAQHFGALAEEEDRRPGRPAIGEPVNLRLGDDLLAGLDAYAAEAGVSRAEAARSLLAGALAAARPYAVTFRDSATGQRETDSRHATLGAAVEALREMQRIDRGRQQRQGLPSWEARAEHDGRPVDTEAYAG